MFKKKKKSEESNLAEYYEAERKYIILESEALKKLHTKENKKLKQPTSF